MTEKQLSEELDNLFSKYSSDSVNIIVPDPDDAATVESWNNLRQSIGSSLRDADTRLVAIRQTMDSFDENTSVQEREISNIVQKTKQLLTTSSLNPDEERFFENFNTSDSIQAGSVVGWDAFTKALSLPIETELTINDKISDVKIVFKEDTNEWRRNLGQLAGHVEDNQGNISILEPDDKQNLNTDTMTLLDPAPYNALEVEQVVLFKTGVNSTNDYLISKYNPSPINTVAIPIAEQVAYSRPPVATGIEQLPYKVVVQAVFKNPTNINKSLLIQQPINGQLAKLNKLSVTLENGTTRSIQEYQISTENMGNIFTTFKVKSIQWELIQTFVEKTPISFQHWVSDTPLEFKQRARHLFVESALLHQKFPSLDPDYQLAILEKILDAGKPIDSFTVLDFNNPKIEEI